MSLNYLRVLDVADFGRDNLFLAERLLHQLKPMRTIGEPDIVFETQILEIEYLEMAGELATALDKVEALIKVKRDDPAAGKHSVGADEQSQNSSTDPSASRPVSPDTAPHQEGQPLGASW